MFVLDAPQPRRMAKANPALAPFAELGGDVFGNENNLRSPPDELVFFRSGFGGDQGKHSASIRRSDGYPALPRWKAGIKGQIKSELIQVES